MPSIDVQVAPLKAEMAPVWQKVASMVQGAEGQSMRDRNAVVCLE